MKRLVGLMLVWFGVSLLVGAIISFLTQAAAPDLELLQQWSKWLYRWRWPVYNLMTLWAGVSLGRFFLKGNSNSLYTAVWGFMLYRVATSFLTVALPLLYSRPVINLFAEMVCLTLVMSIVVCLCRKDPNGRQHAADSGVYLLLLRASLLLATVAGSTDQGMRVPSPVLLAAVLTGLLLALFEFYNIGLGRHYLASALVLMAIALAEIFWRGSAGLLTPGRVLEIFASRVLLPPLVVWGMARLLPDPRKLRLVPHPSSGKD